MGGTGFERLFSELDCLHTVHPPPQINENQFLEKKVARFRKIYRRILEIHDLE